MEWFSWRETKWICDLWGNQKSPNVETEQFCLATKESYRWITLAELLHIPFNQGDCHLLFWKMSWNYFNILCFRSVVVCYFLLLLLVRDVHNVPNHGGNNFLGHQYWNTRYSLNYPSDWDGFWNNGIDGRFEYNRQNSESQGNQCDGCSCSNSDAKVTCTGSPTSL